MHQVATVSFIIPHKGRKNLLEQTLNSIADLIYPKESIEVIVITQNESLELDSQLPTRLPSLRVFHLAPEKTISHLRNYGAEKSTGLFIAFIDADIQLDTRWLEIMQEELSSAPDRVLVSASQRSSKTPSSLETIRTSLSNSGVDSDVMFLPGRNLFLERDVFARSQGFPEHLVTCEDYYFTGSLQKFGILHYTSKSFYIHLGEDQRYPEMFKKEIWRAQSNILSIKGREIPPAEYPSFLVPLWLCFWTIATFIFIITQNGLLVLLALFSLLLPLILYSVRLYRLNSKEINVLHAIGFYCTYFPARTLGTILGLLRIIIPSKKG